jgi:hypothetical protein
VDHGVGLVHPSFALLCASPSRASAESLIQALRAQAQPVVWGWGFPPALWKAVQCLSEVGAVAWWFGGPPHMARDRYRLREQGHVEAFDEQVNHIQAIQTELLNIPDCIGSKR